LAVALGLFLMRGSRTGAPGEASAKAPPVRTPDSSRPAAAAPSAPKPPDESAQPAAAQESPLEKDAREALERLKKFEGLAGDDWDGKQREVRGFLEQFGNTKAADEARTLLNDLEGRNPFVQNPAPPQPGQEPAHPAAQVQPPANMERVEFVTRPLPTIYFEALQRFDPYAVAGELHCGDCDVLLTDPREEEIQRGTRCHGCWILYMGFEWGEILS
jgi:hypothetical protein